jgi:uncharacterized tellurite resistance protein B-like protein
METPQNRRRGRKPAAAWAFRTAADGQAAVFALLIAGTAAARRREALEHVASHAGTGIAARTQALLAQAAQLPAADRMAWIDDALTRVKSLDAAGRERFLQQVAVLIDADRRCTLPEFTLQLLLRARLAQPRPGAGAKLRRQDVVPEMQLLLSLMARAGSDDEETAARNLSRQMFQLTGRTATIVPAAAITITTLTAALERMMQAPALVRETLLRNLAECVTLDGRVKPMETELLAALAARLGVAVPSLDLSNLSRGG